MANEIDIFLRQKVTNGNNNHSKVWGTVSEDQAATGASDFTQSIGTTEETISFGDISPGRVVLYNSDGTNYIQWGFATGVYGARLKPGGAPQTIYLDTTSQDIYVKANTASCKLLVTAYEA